MTRIWVDVEAIGKRQPPIVIQGQRDRAALVEICVGGEVIGRVVYSRTRGPERSTRVWLEIDDSKAEVRSCHASAW